LVGFEAKTEETAIIIRILKGKAVLDTVGVWGSNPHAPTNPFNSLRPLPSFPPAPKNSNVHPSSFGDGSLKFLANRRSLSAQLIGARGHCSKCKNIAPPPTNDLVTGLLNFEENILTQRYRKGFSK